MAMADLGRPFAFRFFNYGGAAVSFCVQAGYGGARVSIFASGSVKRFSTL